ncbi:polysaccharide deacetylase family protein [Microbulbifer sp. SA54]|uniref:polysaccharide deacetylase family protein n=1 Tax=Microbulbifer sp. SA54 TaxID=3401577 RepID=UPI003AB0BECC
MDYPYLTGNTNVIALHRVLEEADLARNLVEVPSMELSSRKLRDFILRLRESGYQFVSLDEAIFLDAPKGAKRIALTFDDGYIDFFEVIFPLLKELEVPACLYLVTGYPDKACFHCFGILEDFVRRVESVEFSWMGKGYRLACRDQSEKRETLLWLDRFVESQVNGVAEVRKLFDAIGVEDDDVDKIRALDWEKTIQLHQDPLITIGSHTLSHPRLSQMSTDKAKREIVQSKLRLEEKLGARVDHFSYPYGDYDRNVAKCVEDAGYLSATTVQSGSYDGGDRFSIKRHWLDAELNPVG